MRLKIADLVEAELHDLDHVLLESVLNLSFGFFRVVLLEILFDAAQELESAGVLNILPVEKLSARAADTMQRSMLTSRCVPSLLSLDVVFNDY